MAYGSPDPVGTCIDAHLLRAMNLDDNSEEGWDFISCSARRQEFVSDDLWGHSLFL